MSYYKIYLTDKPWAKRIIITIIIIIEFCDLPHDKQFSVTGADQSKNWTPLTLQAWPDPVQQSVCSDLALAHPKKCLHCSTTPTCSMTHQTADKSSLSMGPQLNAAQDARRVFFFFIYFFIREKRSIRHLWGMLGALLPSCVVHFEFPIIHGCAFWISHYPWLRSPRII